MYMSEFNQIVNEHYDLSDKETRRYIATLEDAGKDQLLSALSSALYDQIVAKVDDIDFGTIPLSRGDITKVEGFANTEECLNIIRRLVIEYKQPTSIVDVVITAIQNIKDRKAVFIKGYTLNVELPMLLYNLMVLSVVRSTSLMIATCIQFAKDPSASTPKKALDKVAYQKTMDDMLFKQLISFNNMCKNNTIDKILDAAMKHPVHEEVEFQYPGVQVPVTEEEPESDNEPNYPDSPVAPSYNIFGDDETEEEFPEEKHDNEGNILPPEGQQDTPLDNGESDPSRPESDTVEPENIPSVVPGDSVGSDDTAISEDDGSVNEAGVFGTLASAGTKAANVAGALAKAKDAAGTAAKVIGGVALAYGAIKGVSALVIKVFIPFLRNMVYTFYYTKMKFADFLEIQADLIDANAADLENSSEEEDGISDSKRKKAVDKQRKTAEKLRKWANIFNIDRKESENKAKKQATEDEKEKRKAGEQQNSSNENNDDDGDLF